jgi:hypothetical protein
MIPVIIILLPPVTMIITLIPRDTMSKMARSMMIAQQQLAVVPHSICYTTSNEKYLVSGWLLPKDKNKIFLVLQIPLQ